MVYVEDKRMIVLEMSADDIERTVRAVTFYTLQLCSELSEYQETHGATQKRIDLMFEKIDAMQRISDYMNSLIAPAAP